MRWLTALWHEQSLRARITIVATALFAFAVITGAVLLIALQRVSLIRALDSSAAKAGNAVAQLRLSGTKPAVVLAAGGDQIQVVDADDTVVAASPGADAIRPLLKPDQIARARNGDKITVPGERGNTEEQLRVLGVRAGPETVLVASGLGRVEDSVRILRTAALVGSPFGLLTMALATYAIVGRTLRPVAGLRRGAEVITAAGLSAQRLPVPDAQDEIQRLAVTLNAMLDRIDASTTRQRTFVGDAAHELRSPLASLRVQLEVAQRVGPDRDWNLVIDDVLLDVDRLERLVADLLVLARSDENDSSLRRREAVPLGELVAGVVAGYSAARVPVTTSLARVAVDGDPDALRRVVVNLIDNAVRHASSRVEVELSIAERTAEQRAAQLVVRDDGPGIPTDERERVFDRFYRLHASRSRESGGTGLGLPIARDVVWAHGGTLRLTDNEPGLCAVVTLPAIA
ncbi:MAG: ATP-binding protein [Actinomycetota bacterium]